MRRHATALALVGAVVLVGCSEDDRELVSPQMDGMEVQTKKGVKGNATPFTTDPDLKAEIEDRLTEFVREHRSEIAERRAEAGVDTEVATAPLGYYWTGHIDGETVGAEVIFEDRGNKQIAPQWVPGDERRNGRTDIGYAVFPFFGPAAPAGLTPDEVGDAIDRAMGTWASQNCSGGLEIPRGSIIDWLSFNSDILHGGFAPLGPGVLGVTIPSVFVDPATGEPTDVDSDGHPDYAFAEIIYSSQFEWGIDEDIDVETIALHEAGHGLAQGHFGKAFITEANGKVHFSPRALMNAAYSGVQQSLTGTDRGGHCSMYGTWPNN